MPGKSAGILLYRKSESSIEVFLVHPGGPIWARRDEGAWSVPKGEYSDAEDPLAAAQREFEEETGQKISGDFIPLKAVRLKSGKLISAWAVEGDFDASLLKSNFFEMEWPPRSGKKQSFPEVDKGGWFDVDTAKIKINQAQVSLIAELEEMVEKSRN